MKLRRSANAKTRHSLFSYCLFVCSLFLGGAGRGGRGESELPFILSKTGFGYGGAKRLPKAYLILRVQCNRQIEEESMVYLSSLATKATISVFFKKF